MKKRFWLVLLICLLQSKLQAFPKVLDKAIHYSFDVPIHLEKVINNKCYGIEDDYPKENRIVCIPNNHFGEDADQPTIIINWISFFDDFKIFKDA